MLVLERPVQKALELFVVVSPEQELVQEREEVLKLS